MIRDSATGFLNGLYDKIADEGQQLELTHGDLRDLLDSLDLRRAYGLGLSMA